MKLLEEIKTRILEKMAGMFLSSPSQSRTKRIEELEAQVTDLQLALVELFERTVL